MGYTETQLRMIADEPTLAKKMKREVMFITQRRSNEMGKATSFDTDMFAEIDAMEAQIKADYAMKMYLSAASDIGYDDGSITGMGVALPVVDDSINTNVYRYVLGLFVQIRCMQRSITSRTHRSVFPTAGCAAARGLRVESPSTDPGTWTCTRYPRLMKRILRVMLNFISLQSGMCCVYLLIDTGSFICKSIG